MDFTGKWHRISHAGLNPMPIQRPIPVWFGVGSREQPRPPEPVLRRIARLADGWSPNFVPDDAGKALGMNDVFIGVIVVAVIGNAAEHSTAVLVAVKNQMDLAVTIAIGSSLQVALFVAPVLVFAGLAMGKPLNLHFSLMEVIAVMIAVAVCAMVSQDGETHWMEGAMLLGVYVMLALAFYHLPPPGP